MRQKLDYLIEHAKNEFIAAGWCDENMVFVCGELKVLIVAVVTEGFILWLKIPLFLPSLQGCLFV